MYTEQVDTIFRYLGVKLHARYKTSPISLSQVVNAFGIKLRHQCIDDSISGSLIRSSKGNFIIINSNHHYHRRRFSVGHELGHFYFNHPADISTVLCEDPHNPYEVEANRFSSCILMPRQLIFELSKQNKSIREVAEWLRVSLIAAAIRCQQLGYRVDEAKEIIDQFWLEKGDADFADVTSDLVAVSMD